MSAIRSRTARATSASWAIVTPSPGIEVEHQSGCRAGLEFFALLARPLGDEPPLRHVHLQRRLLGDPGQPVGAVDDRIGRRAGPVRDAGPRQPVRRRRRQLLFEERRLLDTVGPALAGGRPAGDVRHHHLGDAGVVVEDVGLGRCRSRGTAPCRRWSASPAVPWCQPTRFEQPSDRLSTSDYRRRRNGSVTSNHERV